MSPVVISVCSSTFMPWLQLKMSVWAESTCALSVNNAEYHKTQTVSVQSNLFWGLPATVINGLGF